MSAVRARVGDSDGDRPVRSGPRLVRVSAGREAALYIKRLVVEGVLPPGSRVPQGEVARALGISRIPIREAIIALEREGVVHILPHRGAYVAPFDADAVRDHYELFGLVYGFAAQRTTERATDAVVADLAAAQRALSKAADPDDVLDLTWVFNNIILEVGGSPRMRALLSTLTGIVPGNFFAVVPAAIRNEQRGTAEIVKAVKRGDAQGAFDACRTMMRAHGQSMLQYLEDHGLFAPTADGTAAVPRTLPPPRPVTSVRSAERSR